MGVDSAVDSNELAVPSQGRLSRINEWFRSFIHNKEIIPLGLDPQSGLAQLITELDADKSSSETANALRNLYSAFQTQIKDLKVSDDLKGRLGTAFLNGNRLVIQSLAFNLGFNLSDQMRSSPSQDIKNKFKWSKQVATGMKNAGGYSVVKPEDWEEVLSKPAIISQVSSPQQPQK